MTTQSVLDPRSPAPEPGQLRQPPLLPLTSIRFFAALHVTLYHLVRPFHVWGPFGGFVAAGYTGVSFFFLLSGFILCYSHAEGRNDGAAFRKRFYFARFARIYPVYLLAQVAASYVMRSQFDTPRHALAWVADLLLVQTWSLRMVSYFNVPAWSIASEAFFYLVFPWAFVRMRPASKKAAVLWVAGSWVLAMIAPVVGLALFPAGSWHEGEGMFAFWVRRSPLLALPEFLAGVSLAWLYLLFPPKAKTARALVVGAGAGIVTALGFADALPALLLHNGLLIPLYGALLVGLARLARERWIVTRALSWAPLVLLGEASYALYLTHYLFGVWLSQRFHVDTGLDTIGWKLAVLLPVSVLLHLSVERPCRKAMLRWWDQRHASVVRGGWSRE